MFRRLKEKNGNGLLLTIHLSFYEKPAHPNDISHSTYTFTSLKWVKSPIKTHYLCLKRLVSYKMLRTLSRFFCNLHLTFTCIYSKNFRLM